MPQTRDWTVLFLGGGSATGKSTLGEALAHHFGARYIDLDLFRVVLQNTIPPGQEPELHLFEPDSVWHLPVEELIQRYQRISVRVCRAIEPILSHRSLVGVRVVIEGVWLLPEFTTRAALAAVPVLGVRALFLHEPSIDEVERRITARATAWYASQSQSVQQNLIQTRHAYGLEIKRQAEALNLPVLESRPFDTLLERALTALEMPS